MVRPRLIMEPRFKAKFFDCWGRDGTVGKLRTEEQKLRTSLHGKFPGNQPQALEAAAPVEALGLFVILDDETGPRMVSKACFQN